MENNMQDNLTCKKCGRLVNCLFRFCPSCGEPLHILLEQINAKPELFIDLMNSLYNLIADKSNEKRTEYLPSLSENIMSRRCKIEFEDEVRSISIMYLTKGGLPDAVLDLYPMALTNSLSGYVYRTIEEFVTHKKSTKLSDADREYLVTSMYKEAEADLRNSCYKVLSENNELDRRVLFCLALRWDNRHLKYLLADDEQQGEWFYEVLSQNIETTINCHERAFEALKSNTDITALMSRRKDAIRDGVEQDILFGYIVKLSESLYPY
jgi:hypothetical protein